MEFYDSPLEIPIARKEVENMTSYSAPLEGRRKLLRLDFNENTIGPSPSVIEAIKQISSNHLSIYPEYNGLQEAITKNLNSHKLSTNIHPAQIGIFNGVDAAIHAIFDAYGSLGEQLLTTTPTFGYYNPCAKMQGMKIIEIPYQEKTFDFPLKNILQRLSENTIKLLIICNPNNPTGTRISPQNILEIAARSPKTLVVIDELYEAFTGDSVLPFIDFQKTSNLIVLRSLSKTAGLAGLRIGFAIGNSKVINIVNRVTGPYDVNSFAVIAAFAALKDQSYIDSYVNEVLEARNWLKNTFEKYQVKYHLDGGNYCLLWPKSDPNYVEQQLKSSGILIRNMDSKKNLKGSVRVSIGTIEQMQKFWSTFKVVDKV